VLSANNETQTIIKGIKHGACDYIVKPVRLEQLRGIWTHVVKNGKTDPRNSISSGSDDDVQKLPSGDADKGENVAANRRKKYSKKNKRVVDIADEDNENTSAQKKQRVRWCGQLHRKFVEAVSQIGIDSKFSCFMDLSINNCSVKYVSLNKYFVVVNAGAVPKKILEIMNVEGLTRENVASHLQVWFLLLCSITMLVFLSTILLLKIYAQSSSCVHTCIEFGMLYTCALLEFVFLALNFFCFFHD
jgi:two-component response regulator (ARR-B family)